MTKKQIISWLKIQREEALAKTECQKNQALEDYSAMLCEKVGLKEVADKCYSLLNAADDLIVNWHKENKEYIGESSCYYGSVRSKISSFISSPKAAYDSLKTYEIPCNSEAQRKIARRFSALHSEVEKTYDTVILNVQRLKNAKLAMEYLKELGFDLSTLLAEDTTPTETALSVPVDTRYLLLGGSHNEN